MRKTVNPTSVKYIENFALNLSSKDVLSCDGVRVKDNVLRGLCAPVRCISQNNFDGLIGYDGTSCCYLHTAQGITRYNITDAKVEDAVLWGVDHPNVCATFYRNKPYIVVVDGGLFRSDGKYYTLLVSKPIRSVAVAGERIVVLSSDGLEVFFGDSGTETVSLATKHPSPSLTLDTQCQALHAFGNNTIYALGPTCYKITLSDNLADIKVQRIAYGLSCVAEHSVATVGDSVVFATFNGLYRLKKDKITRIFSGLDNMFRNYNGARSGLWHDYYTLLVPNGTKRKAFALDVDKQECVGVLYDGLRDIKFFNYKHYMLFSDGTLNYEYPLVSYPSRFVRSAIDFGVAERKYLRRLNIITKMNVDVYVTDDRRTRCLHVKGGKAMQSIPLNGQGRTFTLEIRSKGELEVTCLELVADIYKEAQYVNN